MKNIFRFLKGSEITVMGIILLLIIQAYCDLALPNYTSDVLNVGLQQHGIENAAPITIREETLETLSLFMTEDTGKDVEAAYGAADENGIRHLKEDADQAAISTLLLLPESVLYQMQHSKIEGFSLSEIEQAIKSGRMTREQLQEQINARMANFGNLSDTYLKQVAVSFVAEEYEAQGIDLARIQNHYLLNVGLKMMLMALIMSIAAVLTGLCASRTSAKIGRNLRESIYEQVMRFTNAEMEHFSTASLITRSTNDIQQIQMVIVLLLRMVAYAPILAVFGIIRVIQTRSGMSWIIVLAVIILSILVGILVAIAMPKFRKMQTLVDKLNLVSRELLTGIMPIRAFHREKHEEQRFEHANTNLYKTQLFTNRTMTFMMPLMMFVMNGISVLIVWVGAGKVDMGTIQVGDLTAFITYSMIIVVSFLMLSTISIVLPRAGVAADRIMEVLSTSISLQDPEMPEDEKLETCQGNLVFSDVSFSYPDSENYALEHISFTAESGQVTAIIGSTGCGKTTLLNLIPRFFDVSDGQITLDGIDIRNLSQKTLREKIGYVPQKGMLFSGTVESNIKYSGSDISDSDMKEAARIAQAEEFIEVMPNRYQANIAQEGSNVSGGQRQRLSIARAIAKHPRVYLFDDSFSALDYQTDLALRKELLKFTENATVIIVAQRISTILHADKILCMDEGKIVGQGTHEELLANCKIYMEIAKSQLSAVELQQTGGIV